MNLPFHSELLSFAGLMCSTWQVCNQASWLGFGTFWLRQRPLRLHQHFHIGRAPRSPLPLQGSSPKLVQKSSPNVFRAHLYVYPFRFSEVVPKLENQKGCCVLRAPAEDRALLGEEKLWGNFSSLCRLLSFVVPEVHGCPLMKSFFVAR